MLRRDLQLVFLTLTPAVLFYHRASPGGWPSVAASQKVARSEIRIRELNINDETVMDRFARGNEGDSDARGSELYRIRWESVGTSVGF